MKKLLTTLTLVCLLTISALANYRDQMDLARDPIFVQRVKLAMVQSAITISAESTGTANHVARTALSKACLNSPDQYAQIFAVLVAADAINFPAVITRNAAGDILTSNGATAGADAGIDGRVLNVWNAVAGLP